MRPDDSTTCNCSLWKLTATILLFLALPLSAQIELDKPVDEFPPTSEDLNGAAAAPSGEIIAVGNGATVLRRTTTPEGEGMWESLNEWADGFFNAAIFDVAHSPASYANGEAWVISGRGGVVETDFTTTLEIEITGGNEIFTPVLATEDEIWYGVPDLSSFPSFLHRYDRATQTNPGIAFVLGPVLAMCQVPGGNLRYVTTDGDIEEIDDDLFVTQLYDQPGGQSLELNAASFSEDCQVISAGDAGPLSRVYAGFIDALAPDSATGPSPWRHVDNPGGPVVTASCFLTSDEQGRVVGYFATLLRCSDGVPTGDEATMSAFVDLLESRILNIQSHNEQEKCQRDAAIVSTVQNRSAQGPPEVVGFELLTVGTQGRVQLITGRGPLFADAFETGDLSSWSVVVD